MSTDASPSRLIVSRSLALKTLRMCSSSAGAPTVATATMSGRSVAATRAAVPPRLCPIRRAGVIPAVVIALAADLRSVTSAAKSTASPSAPPTPVPAKSNRRTPIPARDSAREMWTAARLSFPHVKQ